LLQGNEYIGVSGVDYLYLWMVSVDEAAKAQGNIEYHILFSNDGTQGARVFAAVAWVDDNGEGGRRCCLQGAGQAPGEECQEEQNGVFAHAKVLLPCKNRGFSCGSQNFNLPLYAPGIVGHTLLYDGFSFVAF
jgi:hypothetical protein